MDKQVIIRISSCRYVWWPLLQIVDCVPKGCSTPWNTIHLRDSENTELGALIKATDHMLKELKRSKAERKNETSETV